MSVRFVAFGGFDDRKPRVRLLLAALRRAGVLADVIAIPVWRGMDEKSLPTKGRLVKAGFRLITGLPIALWRLARSSRGSVILLPYPGTPEIFLVAPIARLLRRKVVLDAFLPLHDTIVRDRRLMRDGSLPAKLVWLYEWAGLRLADRIIVDTDQHAIFFAGEFGIARERIVTVLVGAEPLFDPAAPVKPVDDIIGLPDARRVVLFYGLLIPLHGLPTILEAMRQCPGEGIHWVLVGRGQLEQQVRAFMANEAHRDITYVPWVDYGRLPALIARADLCLGVFGTSDKAARVIPNKIFQALAMRRRIVTRSSAAIEPLAQRMPGVLATVPAGDPGALAQAVRAMLAQPSDLAWEDAELAALSPDRGLEALIASLEAG